MNIKRFFASDTRKALNMVRKEFGEEAIIISNRSVDNGVEILAADDFDDELSAQGEINTNNATHLPENAPAEVTKADKRGNSFAEKIKDEIQARSTKKTQQSEPDIEKIRDDSYTDTGLPTELFDVRRITESNIHDGTPQQDIIRSMRAEISKLRGLMENKFTQNNKDKGPRQSSIHHKLVRQFQHLGLSNNLSTAMVNTLQEVDILTPQEATRDALGLLTRQIRTTDDDVLVKGGIVVLIGPAGAGKTTTLAKLASQFIHRHHSKDIILVSTDTHRLGAQEQLMAYGRLLGIPVLKAKDQNEINQILNAVKDKKLVLVDSGSLTQSDLRNPQALPTMHTQVEGLKHYLVMPASMQAATLDHIVKTLTASGLIEAGILTKVDDAINLGGALSAAIQHKLPIAYWSDGQKISSHLYPAKSQQLVSKAVAMVRTTPKNSNLEAQNTMGDTTQFSSNHA
jgi:flagellar biosynthesis protein FlhF